MTTLLTCVLYFGSIASNLAHAQVGPITPSGLDTQVSGPIAGGGRIQYDITGGTRPGGGANLFHSFGDFNVPPNNIANFLNDTGLPTSNILGRVTGGNISNIFGTIQTTNFGNANLFLMNPAGFLFGPNATVNVGGMVSFTSADYLKLTDNARFNAIPNAAADALLTALPVASFGFLGSNPGAITVQGSQFTVSEGQGISLVGGNITVEGGTPEGGALQPARLSTPGGQINLASVTSPGEVLVTNFLTEPGITRGTITLSQGSTLDVSGTAAGTVRIRGGQFMIADATLSADTGNVNGAPVAIDIDLTGDLSISDTRDLPAITARTVGDGNAGEVRITSANLGATSSSVELFALIDSHTTGTGKAGNINITTGNLQPTGTPGGFFFIDSGTAGPGNGSDITINASTVQIRNANISTGDFVARNLSLDSSGSGGSVTIAADSLQVDFGIIDTGAFLAFADSQLAGNLTLNIHDIHAKQLQIGALGFGGGGAIRITADSFVADTTVLETDVVAGLGGGITLDARIVELTNGSGLISTTFGDGKAGDIRVTATDHIKLSGTDLDANPTGFLSNSTGDFGAGEAGAIVVTAPRLEMTGGARINTATLSSGRGGDVTITTTDAISISGEFPTSEPEPIFGIGTIHPSGIFTKTAGSDLCIGPCGDAGQISITTGSLVLGNGAQIDSGTSNNGRGGDITINPTNTISMAGTLSDGSPVGVFSRTIGTEPDAGAGGNITLAAGQSVTISEGAAVSANSSGAGNAGNITIQGLASPANSVLINGMDENFNPSGIFTDTQGTGAGGDIFVNANTVTLQNGGTLSASTSDTNNGGDIQVDATAINLLTFASINTLSFLSDGSAGNIALKATQQITAVDSFLNTDAVGGTGLGGNILLRAPTIGVNGGVLSATTSGTGHAGNVLLEGQQISLGASPSAVAQGADLFAGTFGSGHGGTVILRGLDGPSSQVDNVTISGTTRIHTLTGSDGSAGDITINAAQFTLTDHATLNADTFGSGGAGTITITATDHATVSGLFTTVSSSSDFGATGNAGQISVSAPTVMIENGGSISTNTTGEGTGGNINILASQSVTMTNGSSISASSTGPGNAGNILINAGQNYTSTDSTVTTQAAQASGGNITVLATDMVQLTNSQLNASVQGSSMTVGGNIVIDPQFVILQNSQILAKATQGQGGNISITTGLLLADATSVISASSQFGVNGTVTIQSPNAPASGKIQPLGKTPLQATSLLNQPCAALAGGEFSSFTVAGRDSLPTEPGSWLASPLASLSAGTGLAARGAGREGDIQILSLRQIAPAGFLTQAFALDWSASCTS